MSAKSPNGWPVSPNPEDIDIAPMKVGSAPFTPGVRGGRVLQVLSYVANAVHTRVQHASSVYGCWGYSFRENVNSPGVWSNHASGTAIDFNASKNPNGVPASECFTPAQIDEIHAILDEVNGAVRWGGDYSGTPDPMHFEIDVTPAELEAMDLPDVVTSVTIGSPDYRTAPEMVANSVSYPTMAVYATYPYWKFTATQTGRISVDALLSHYVDPKNETPDGPSVTINVYESVNDSPSTYVGGSSGYSVINLPGFPAFPGSTYRVQGRTVLNVVAGKTYFIRANASGGYPYIRMVIRIGDYAPVPDWTQPPDQQRIWAYPDSSFGANVTDPTNIGVIPRTSSFTGGELEAWRGFGQPTPGSQPDAIACVWRWNRRFYSQGQFNWEGACPNYSYVTDVVSQHNGQAVGHYYHSDEYTLGFFYYQEIRFRVFLQSFVFQPENVISYEKRNGQAKQYDYQATYLPTLQPNEVLEWESAASELVDVDYSWDERPWSNDHSPYPLTVKWYVGDWNEPRNPGEWGPNPAGGNWYGQGSDSPENWTGSQTHLGDSTNGATTWRQLDPEYWEGEDHTTARFTVLPAEMLSDTLPSYGGQSLVSNELYVENYKTGCYMALKTTVRPSRYRIHPDPGIPDLPWVGVNAISIDLEESSPVLY